MSGASQLAPLPEGFRRFIGSLSDLMMIDSQPRYTGVASSAAPTAEEQALARASLTKHVRSGEYTAADYVQAKKFLNPSAEDIARRAARAAKFQPAVRAAAYRTTSCCLACRCFVLAYILRVYFGTTASITHFSSVILCY